jgi:TetR/AcrR family transcriptional regulator
MRKAKTREKAKDGAVRDRLIDAAVTLFATRGYAATSTREIVEAAGVTKPALYYYFDSKEGIFRAILEEAALLTAEVLRAGAQGSGPIRARIERLFLSMYEQFERHKTVVRFMNSVLWGPPQEIPRCNLGGLHAQFVATVRGLVEEGIASGELRPARPADVVRTLVALISYTFDVSLAFPRHAPGKAGLRRDLDLLFRGLAGPAPEGGR